MMKRKIRGIPIVALTIALLIGIGLFVFYYPTIIEAEQQAGLGVTVHYTDGATRAYDAPVSWQPLAVLDTSGKAIDKITVTPSYTVTYTGTFQSGALTGDLAVLFDGEEKRKETLDQTITTLTSGAKNTLSSITVLGSEIQTWDENVFGEHEVAFVLSLGINITFTDGTTDSRSGIAKASVTVTVTRDSGIQSLDVAINSDTLQSSDEGSGTQTAKFSIKARPSNLDIRRYSYFSSSKSVTITITPTSDMTMPSTFTFTYSWIGTAPTGVTVSFSKSSIVRTTYYSFYTTVAVKASPTATLGTFTLRVTATSTTGGSAYINIPVRIY